MTRGTVEVVPKGTRFDRWTVIKEVSPKEYPGGQAKRQLLCECSCSDKTRKKVLLNTLKRGQSRSCGCINKQENKRKSDISGSRHKLHSTYKLMVHRCTNNEHANYGDYGGRGIKICKDWLKPNGEGFRNFLSWSEANGWYEGCGLSIDRENNDKGYNPDNCQWIPIGEQQRNKRNNHKVKYKGKIYTTVEVYEKHNKVKGLSLSAFIGRVTRDVPVEEALTRPLRITKRTKFK